MAEKALQRTAEGEAVDPDAFRSFVLGDKKRRTLVEADSEMNAALNGNNEELQAYLKTQHARTQETPGGSLAETIRARTQIPRDVTVLYHNMAEVGLNYGPKFSMLEDVHVAADAALR